MGTSPLQSIKISSIKEILGLDISCNSTGVAWHDGDKFRSTAVQPPSTGKNKLNDIQRLDYYITWVEGFIKRHSGIKLAVIEDYAMGNKGAAQKTREVGGVLKTILHKNGVALLLVPPSSLKLFATGKGNADSGSKDKPMMREAASSLGFTAKTTDEVDAFHLLVLGAYTYGVGSLRDRERAKKLAAVDGKTVFYQGKDLITQSDQKGVNHDQERATESGHRPCIHSIRRRATEDGTNPQRRRRRAVR